MKGIKVLNGRATIMQPTASYHSWRVIWRDPVSGKRRTTSGGDTRDSAEAKARQLLEDYVPDEENVSARPPTFDECYEAWMTVKRPDIAEQTAANYDYVEQRFLSPAIGSLPITSIGANRLRSVEISGVEFPVLVKRIVKGTFDHAKSWTRRDGDYYANAIKTRSSRNEKRSTRVERGDIPGSKLVASFITTAYSTLQPSPLDDPATTSYDPERDEKRRTVRRQQFAPGLGLTQPIDYCFLDGVPYAQVFPKASLPIDMANDSMLHDQRLGFMKRRAMIYRRVGLITAIGAGAGPRIGEVLALRVRHVLSREQVTLHFQFGQPRESSPWHGEMKIYEQITRGGTGQIRLTTPKYDHKRIVHLPAFLPDWNGFAPNESQRSQIAEIIPRFADPSISLWSATDDECLTLWRKGFTPLCMLMWRHLDELWESMPRKGKPSMQSEIDTFLNMILFPSASRGIPSKTGMTYEPNWPYDRTIPEGTGGYQHPSNYMKTAALIYDYVAGIYNEWPEHRANSPTRKGWTHHSLRHYATSSRLQAGVPLTTIARELGHKDASFTLERYGHMLPEAIPETGFEY